jgi:hypothetical protein
MQKDNKPSDQSGQARSRIRDLIPSAVSSLLIPVAGYFAAYRYEVGYCEYWGIPEGLIKLDVTNLGQIAMAAISLIVILMGVESLAQGILVLLPPIPSGRLGNTLKQTASLFIYLFLAIAFNFIAFPIREIWVFSLVLFTILIAYIVMWIIALKRGKPEAQKTAAPPIKKKAPSQDEQPSVPSILSNVLGPRTIIIVMLTYTLSMVAYSWGMANARRQSTFYRIADSETVITVKIYGSNLIAKHFDEVNYKLIDPIEIIPYDDGASIIRITKKDLKLRNK